MKVQYQKKESFKKDSKMSNLELGSNFTSGTVSFIPAISFLKTYSYQAFSNFTAASEYHVPTARMECQNTFYSNLDTAWQNKQK